MEFGWNHIPTLHHQCSKVERDDVLEMSGIAVWFPFKLTNGEEIKGITILVSFSPFQYNQMNGKQTINELWH